MLEALECPILTSSRADRILGCRVLSCPQIFWALSDHLTPTKVYPTLVMLLSTFQAWTRLDAEMIDEDSCQTVSLQRINGVCERSKNHVATAVVLAGFASEFSMFIFVLVDGYLLIFLCSGRIRGWMRVVVCWDIPRDHIQKVFKCISDCSRYLIRLPNSPCSVNVESCSLTGSRSR